MIFEGSTSWQVRQDRDRLLEVALLARDVARLPVPEARDLPPALIAATPDRSFLLGPADPEAMAEVWTAWWRELVEVERPAVDAAPMVPGQPELNAVLREAHIIHSRRFGWTWDPPEGQLSWEECREAAEAIAFDNHVDLGQIRGQLIVLPASGRWWSICRPGVVLCSDQACADAVTRKAVLYSALRSSVPL